MLKLKVNVRLMPEDESCAEPGVTPKVAPKLARRLDKICAGGQLKWRQLTSEAFFGDILVEDSGEKTEDWKTKDMLDAMEAIADAVKTDGRWAVSLKSSAVGWDDDGFMLKADFRQDGTVGVGSPNWLLSLPTAAMTDVRLLVKDRFGW